jgi:hypothetical protein
LKRKPTLFIILAITVPSLHGWVDDLQTDEKETTEFIKIYIKELKSIGILISDATRNCQIEKTLKENVRNNVRLVIIR